MHADIYLWIPSTTAVPPEVISQPQSLTDIVPKTTVTFSVEVAGDRPLRYAWEYTKQRYAFYCMYML